MVPDLRMLPFATNRDFWKIIATHGKPGTLMPAFVQAGGGPLTDAQIDSIAAYLLQVYSPGHPATPGASNPAQE
jgi:mono/diheme cytochrome c family protein